MKKELEKKEEWEIFFEKYWEKKYKTKNIKHETKMGFLQGMLYKQKQWNKVEKKRNNDIKSIIKKGW